MQEKPREVRISAQNKEEKRVSQNANGSPCDLTLRTLRRVSAKYCVSPAPDLLEFQV